MSNSCFAANWTGKGILLASSALSLATVPTAAWAQAAPTADQGVNPDVEAAPETTSPEAETTDADVIVVTGIRGALETARNIKRKSDTFVDSITATDISTLPDLSVAEALGRIPGVTVSRYPQGGASPDFPSPEGRGNLIRGLGFTRSEFNGRDAFSANGGRVLDWSSIPPELVGAVDVFKNQTADLIEGGIGGTINLRTLEPFDRKGRVIAAALDFTYSDLRKKWSPQGSITLGNRWSTGLGEVGLLASYSRSKLSSQIHGWQQSSPNPRVLGADGNVPMGGGMNGFTGPNRLNEFAGVDPSRIIGTTTGFQLRTNEIDRDRESFYSAAQWRNDRLKATAKFIRVNTNIESVERTFEWWPEHDNGAQIGISDLVLNPDWSVAGTPLCSGGNAFPSNPGQCENLIPIGGGLMESGLVTNTQDAWTGAYGSPIGSLGIGKREKARTQDVSLNLQWAATDRLSVHLDGQYTKSKARMNELWAGLNTYLNFRVNHDLEDPSIEFFVDPRNAFSPGLTRYTGDSAGNPIPLATGSGDLNNANFQYVDDRFQRGSGDLYSLRADANYDISESDGVATWFDAVRFGARYSERDQRNAEIQSNWGGISPAWAGGYGIAGTFQDPARGFQVVDFSDFFRGGVIQGGNTAFPFVHEDLLLNYSGFREYLAGEPQIGTNHPWMPRGTANGSVWGTPNFMDSDISDITEKTKNAYLRLDFGQEFGGGMSIDGNVGIRYARTDLESTGFLAFRPFNPDLQEPEFLNGARRRTPDAESRDDPRDFLPEAAAYAAQAAMPIDYKMKDTHWLPSLNVKWNLNEEMLIRFGASKGLSRPNVQDLRGSQQYVVNTTRVSFPMITDPADPLFGIDRGAQDIRLSEIRVSRGNPRLRPTTANNFDLSYEYYFKGGYLSLAGFLKKLKNVQVYGEEAIGTETLDGYEVPIIYNGIINQAKARIRGVEVSYQQFYDFLPGLLGNLGTQANYTFIDAKTTPPPLGIDADGNGVVDDVVTAFRYGVDDMLGQSKHIANAVGIYQDDKLEARLAYQWRSRYLVTYRDYVTGNPVFINAGGTLDASLKYQFTEQLQVRGSVANLLDTKSKAKAMITQDGRMYDRFSFLNDRRFVIGVLAQF